MAWLMEEEGTVNILSGDIVAGDWGRAVGRGDLGC
jgi:hypothetical protein